MVKIKDMQFFMEILHVRFSRENETSKLISQTGNCLICEIEICASNAIKYTYGISF